MPPFVSLILEYVLIILIFLWAIPSRFS